MLCPAKYNVSYFTLLTPYMTPFYNIFIPKHEPIKRVYVELVKEVVEKEDANHENN